MHAGSTVVEPEAERRIEDLELEAKTIFILYLYYVLSFIESVIVLKRGADKYILRLCRH